MKFHTGHTITSLLRRHLNRVVFHCSLLRSAKELTSQARMSFVSKHKWLPLGTVEKSLTSALSDHLQRSHLTSPWMPENLCEPHRLGKVARRFIDSIKSPIDDTDLSSDNWSANVSGTEGDISIVSTLKDEKLRIQMSYVKESGAKTEEFVYTSSGLVFTV